MSLQISEVIVTDRDGNQAKAEFVSCACGCDFFYVWQLRRESGCHQHLECADCHTSYCDNTCDASNFNLDCNKEKPDAKN